MERPLRRFGKQLANQIPRFDPHDISRRTLIDGLDKNAVPEPIVLVGFRCREGPDG